MIDGSRSSVLAATRIFDGHRWWADAVAEIADGQITRIAPDAKATAITRRLPAGVALVPGFVDVQVNGGGGVLLNDQPTLDGIRAIATAHRQFGTTGMLPTLITDAPDVLDRLLDVGPEALTIPGVIGFHIEGPFINPARKGVHRADLIRPLDDRGRKQLLRLATLGRSMVTVAPEIVKPTDIRMLVSAGLRIALGHSDATAEQAAAAVDAGATGITHLYNAMSQMTPRASGVVGAALSDDRLYAGIIADGHHVAPANLRAACRALGSDRLLLVTDAMPSVGDDRPHFTLQGRDISLKDDRLTTADGTLAGAHLSMNEAVRRMMRDARCSLDQALIMAARTPAEFLGLQATHGVLTPGAWADIVAIDLETFAVKATWVGGVPSA